MADIPTYQPQATPRPLPAPYDDSRVPPGAFGAGVGEGLQQVADTVGEFARKAKADADATQVLTGAAALRNFITDSVDGPDGLKSKYTGRDAVAQSGPALEAIQKKADELAGTMKNADQQRVFRIHAMTLTSEAQAKVETYAGAQSQQANVDATNARIDAGMRAVGADPSTRPAEERRMVQALVASQVYQGAAPEKRQEMQAQVLAKSAEVAMNSYLAQNLPTQARAVFAQTRDLLGDKAPVFEARIREHEDAQQAMTTGIALAQKYRINDFGVLDVGKAVDELNAIAAKGQITAERYAKTLAILNEQNAAGHTQQTTALGGAYQTLMSVYDKGGTVGVLNSPVAIDAARILQDPRNIGGANLYDAFLKHQLDQAPTPAQDAAFWRARNAVFADEWNRYAQMGSDQLVASVDETTGRPWAQELTRRQLEQLAALQTEAKTRLLSKDAHTLPAGVETELKVAGFRAGLWGSKGPQNEDQQRLAAYIATQIDQNVQGWWRDPKNKAPPMPADYQKWISDQLIKGTVPSGGGFGFRGGESVFPIPVPDAVRETTPVEGVTRAEAGANVGLAGRGFIPKIPSKERQVIERALKKGGFEVNDDNVMATYKARHGLK